MKYFYIYSAGGGAGDWNGVKRIWSSSAPKVLKQAVLIKFGDIYFNHASSKQPIKTNNWNNILNARKWLSDAVGDESITKDTEIILDNGTSKLINYISHGITKDALGVITEFDSLINKYEILQKYSSIITDSDINYAVTIDLPNTFKIRSQSEGTTTDFFDATHYEVLIDLCAKYANTLYELQGSADKLMVAINGLWSKQEMEKYLSKLSFKPKNIAVGALTKANEELIENSVKNIKEIFSGERASRIHFLGCGGIKRAQTIKKHINGPDISVDNSTPMNRAIDGNTKGTSFSGYFAIKSKQLYRIREDTASQIMGIHTSSAIKCFSDEQMANILRLVIAHQSGQSSKETYDARAMLSFHNHFVFLKNAE
jgi:hypothetical protein